MNQRFFRKEGVGRHKSYCNNERRSEQMAISRIQKLLLLGALLVSSYNNGNFVDAKSITNHSMKSKTSNNMRTQTEYNVIRELRGGEFQSHLAQHSSFMRRQSSPLLLKQKLQLLNKSFRGGSEAVVADQTPQDEVIVVPKPVPNLNLIRIMFLSFYGSLGVLMPYLPVYYHSLGHDGMYIGLLGAVKPLTTFIFAPAWGMISDRANAHSTILQYTFIIGLLLQIAVCFNDSIWWLVTTVFFSALMNAPVKSLLDCMVMNTLSEEAKSEYGKMRLWGQIGFGLGSSGIGVLLHKSIGIVNAATGSPESTTTALAMALEWFQRHIFSKLTGYKIAFFAHGLLSIPTLICMQKFRKFEEKAPDNGKKEEKKEGAHILQGFKHLAHDGNALFFFFLVLVVGVSSGCIENFAYVRMREVGGTGREMGLSRLVSSAAGAPMFWFSGKLSNYFGEETILVMSLLSYVIRFFIYALMKHPLHGLPAEALRGLTFAAFWSTGTIYAYKISPPGMQATMQMLLNAMYGGLGQSLGAIIGGKLQSKVGTVDTFIYSGIFDFCFVVFVVCYLNLRNHRVKNRGQQVDKLE